ncbi:MAG: hypothetical protein KKG60_02095 [Nanoarchaeota archaeon]|nr:hypothetical protein [Nanoarchaeota archaeon]
MIFSFTNIQPYVPPITGMDVIEEFFGTLSGNVMILKLGIAIILFAILLKGAERLFHDNRGAATIIALLISVISVVFIPNEYFLALTTSFGAMSMAILVGVVLVLPWVVLDYTFQSLRGSRGKWLVYAIVYALIAFFFAKLSGNENLRRISPSIAKLLDFISGTGILIIWIVVALCIIIFFLRWLGRNGGGGFGGGGDGLGGGGGGRTPRASRIDWDKWGERTGKAAEGFWKGLKWGGKQAWKGAKLGGREAKYQIQYENIRRKYEGYIQEEQRRIMERGRNATPPWNEARIQREMERASRNLSARMQRELGIFREKIKRGIRRGAHQEDADNARSRELTSEIYQMAVRGRRTERRIEELNESLHSGRLSPTQQTIRMKAIRKMQGILEENNREIRNRINELPPDWRRKVTEAMRGGWRNLRRWFA